MYTLKINNFPKLRSNRQLCYSHSKIDLHHKSLRFLKKTKNINSWKVVKIKDKKYNHFYETKVCFTSAWWPSHMRESLRIYCIYFYLVHSNFCCSLTKCSATQHILYIGNEVRLEERWNYKFCSNRVSTARISTTKRTMTIGGLGTECVRQAAAGS